MSQPWTTGPALLYCGVGSSFAPLFLGTCERPPRITLRPEYEAYFNDLAGQRIPMDQVFQGEDGIVSIDLNRWDESVLTAIQARPRHSASGSIRGTLQAGDIGTMMKTEGFDYPLWMKFPYFSKAAYAAGVPGYKFYQAHLLGPDDMDQLGTMPRRNRLVFYCSQLWTLSSGNLTGILYDTLSASFSGLPVIS